MAGRPRLRASRCFRFLCSFLAMPAAPEPLEALNPKTDIFLIAIVYLYFATISFDFYRGYSSVGTGRDLSDLGL